MLCQEASELMSLKLDNRLDEVGQRELDTHISGCETCQNTWAYMRRINNVFERAQQSQPPSAFSMLVMQRIRRRKLVRSLLRGAGIVAGSSAAVVLAFGLLAFTLSPLTHSITQYPFIAFFVSLADSLTSIGRTCGYALRLVLSSTLNSSYPLIVIGYLMVAIFLIIWWTRALLVPRKTQVVVDTAGGQ